MVRMGSYHLPACMKVICRFQPPEYLKRASAGAGGGEEVDGYRGRSEEAIAGRGEILAAWSRRLEVF